MKFFFTNIITICNFQVITYSSSLITLSGCLGNYKCTNTFSYIYTVTEKRRPPQPRQYILFDSSTKVKRMSNWVRWIYIKHRIVCNISSSLLKLFSHKHCAFFIFVLFIFIFFTSSSFDVIPIIFDSKCFHFYILTFMHKVSYMSL